MTRTRTIHYCNVCDYKTDRKYDRDKHVTRMHGSNVQQNASQAHEIGFNITQESIQHTYPNEDYNVNNIQNQAVGDDTASSSATGDTLKVSTAIDVDMQHGLGIDRAQDNQTVSLQEHKNIVEETYKWQDAYEGQKQGNIMKDNAIKIRDMHLLKTNKKLLSEINKNKDNNEKIAAMGKYMRRLITKYKSITYFSFAVTTYKFLKLQYYLRVVLDS